MAEIEARAQAGDLAAMEALRNHYGLREGDYSERLFYWQLQAARLGDCRQRRSLMFVEFEDDGGIPRGFFAPGETLETIGERAGCGPHERVKRAPPER